MSDANSEQPRRVLIASANPLFARGLQKLMVQRWRSRSVEVRFAGTMQEISAVLETWRPDLVILDYDDEGAAGKPGIIQREAFLSQFIAGARPMQVMLVSLRESGEVIVYDRRTLTPAQAEDWLDLPWAEPRPLARSAALVSEAPRTPAQAELDPNTTQSAAPLPQESAGQGPLIPVIHPKARSGGMKHYIIPGILTIILTVIIGLAMNVSGLMPDVASTQAVPIDAMIALQVWMIAFLFSLITVFIVYSVVVFRSRRKNAARAEATGDLPAGALPASTAPGARMKGSNTLEVAWTIVPLITVIVLSFIGAQDLGAIRKAEVGALEVKVTAFQWGWSYEYPASGITSSTLVLPVNRQVRLLLTSRDVIHSFWVPEFRVKQDILPGENLVKELRVTPTTLGYYTVRCAEMCGLNHAGMEGPVMVVTQTGFDDWVEQKKASAAAVAASGTPAERGQALSQTTGCLGCHSVDGSRLIGPTWQGVAGSQVQLTDGSTLTVDDAYLYDGIVDPSKHVRQGFAPGIMPETYATQLTDEQIKDIIEFIKSLK